MACIEMLISFAELDVCIYLMSAVGVKMEVEEGASATVVELINTLMDQDDELGLPRGNYQTMSAANNPSESPATHS